MRTLFFALIGLLAGTVGFAQVNPLQLSTDKQKQVNDIISAMSLEEKVGQLFMVAAYSNKPDEHRIEIENLITKYHIGGVIFFQGGPVRQSNLLNRYQNLSKYPLLTAMDAEWGPSMRLDSTLKFPYQMTMGALQNDSLIYQMGQAVGIQCRRLGVVMNMAPVADLNNNPNNPVINYRSFGENRETATRKMLMYMKGMQDVGILTVAKHFPGHGDTDVDSHLDLPVINRTAKQLDSLELYPFKKLIAKGVEGMMNAHLYIPSLETRENMPATLSKSITTDLLQKKLKFQGLVLTDALNMKGVAKYYQPGDVDLAALLAGNDILLFSENVPKGIERILNAVKTGKITEEEIGRKAAKIMAAKMKTGLFEKKLVITNKLFADLNKPTDKALVEKIYNQAVTVVKNDNSLLPIKKLDGVKILNIAVGITAAADFQNFSGKYTKVGKIYLPLEASDKKIADALQIAKGYDVVLLSVHNLKLYPKNSYGLGEKGTAMLSKFLKQGKMNVIIFGNPYVLSTIPDIDNAQSIMVTYQENTFTQQAAAQAVFGSIKAKGKLPVSVSAKYKFKSGIETASLNRLQYTVPEAVGYNSEYLNQKIDSIANTAIALGAFPGCQVLAAKDGVVFFHKAYGFHTYDSLKPVLTTDIYDLASVTKIAASAPALLSLYDQGKINLNQPLAKYYKPWRKTNKKDLVLSDILTHQAGLTAWIPFWKQTKNPDGTFKKKHLILPFQNNFRFV